MCYAFWVLGNMLFRSFRLNNSFIEVCKESCVPLCPGLVDFAIRLVNSVWGEIKYKKSKSNGRSVINPDHPH